MIEIKYVQGKSDLMRFIKFPWSVYRDCPQWVPPLIMDQKVLLTEKNPFYRHSEAQHMLAWRDGQLVGRISAMVDQNYVAHQKQQTGLFGFFESRDDPAVAEALLTAAGSWLKDRGMERMIGPTNPSTNDTLGVLLDAYDTPPMVMMPYNLPYYPGLLVSSGLQKAADMYAYLMEEESMDTSRMARVSQIVQKRQNISLEKLDKKRFGEAVGWVKEVYNDAWLDNEFFVPWSDEEMQHLGDDLKPVVDQDLVLFARQDGEIAGFSIALPDVYQALIKVRNGRLFPFGLIKLLWHSRKISQTRIAVLGIKKKFRNLGLDALLYYQTFLNGTGKGIHRGEASWILDSNTVMRNAAEGFGARIYKTYRLYRKELS